MQISRKGQSHKQKVTAIDLLIVLFAFTGPVINVLLYLMNRQSESGQMAIAYIVVAAGSVLLLFKHAKRYLPVQILLIVGMMLIGTASFFLTKERYGYANPIFVSEQRAYVAMEVCVLLLSINVFWNSHKDINLHLIMLFDIVLTTVSFLVLISGNKLTPGGLIADTSGFLYQNISYYAAYCLGFNMFLLSESKHYHVIKINKFGMLVLSLVQMFICIVSGGRGGTVLAIIFVVYGIFAIYGVKETYKIVIPLAILFLITIFVVPTVVERLGINAKGLTRVLSLFGSNARNNASDRGRIALAKGALSAFYDRPIFGNGIGSIFYLIGSYSHNMFMDIIAECGLVGAITMSAVFLATFIKAKRLYNCGSLYRFFVILLISGLSLNFVSGYVWVNQQIWLPVAVFLLSPIHAKRTGFRTVENT